MIKLYIEDDNYYIYWILLSFWNSYSFFYYYKINNNHLYLIFTLVSISISLIGYYQFFSGHQFIVGIYDNPTGFSCSLVCLIPFVYKYWRDSKSLLPKYISGLAILAVLAVLLLSESRTAVISIFVIGFLLIPKKYKKGTFILNIILLIMLILFFKTNSSLGRIFILIISFKMIKIDNILWGNGSGFFKNQYMTFQSEYFKNIENERYAQAADNIFHPMNEFLLFIIEHGIIFFIFLIILLILYLKKVNTKTPEFLSLISILVFSLFSYPFRYPIIILIVAYDLASLSLKRSINIKYPSAIKLILVPFFSFWIIHICYDSYNNYIWNEVNKKSKLGQFKKVQETYSILYNYMDNNPYFLFNYSSTLFNQKDYKASLSYAIKTNNILNNYDTQLLLADNYKILKRYNESLYHYTESSYMCPNRFIPLYGIYNIYKEIKDYKKMDSIGNIILTKEIKIKSPTIDNIIDVVKKEKEVYNNIINDKYK